MEEEEDLGEGLGLELEGLLLLLLAEALEDRGPLAIGGERKPRKEGRGGGEGWKLGGREGKRGELAKFWKGKGDDGL